MREYDLPNLTVLRQFVEIDRAQGITRAARNLGVSQSALSKNMRRLERTVGADLFTRHTRGTELTSAGEAFLRHARRVLIEYRNAVELARNSTMAGTRALRVGAGVGFGMTIIPRSIPLFQTRLPGHRLMIQTLGVEEVLRNLELNRIDIAAHALARFTSSKFTREPIYQTRRAIMCARNHPLAQQDAGTIPLEAVAEFPLVALGIDSVQKQELESIVLRSNAKPLTFAVECDSTTAVLNILQDANHLMFGSALIAEFEPAGNIVSLPVEIDLGRYEIGFIFDEGSDLIVELRAFMAAVRKTMALLVDAA